MSATGSAVKGKVDKKTMKKFKKGELTLGPKPAGKGRIVTNRYQAVQIAKQVQKRKK